MKRKAIIFALTLFTSFSGIVTSQPSTPTSPAPQPTSSPQNPQQDAVKKPNMAEYCKHHTC
jgi:hypothetical protein